GRWWTATLRCCQRWWRDGGPHLLHQPEDVLEVSLLDDFAIGDAEEGTAGNRDALPRGGNPHECPTVGAGHREPRAHIVPLGNQVLDGHVPIRQGCQPHSSDFLEGRKAAHGSGDGRVIAHKLRTE